MGTRVCAWIGNPHDYENREYLGSLAYDGYNIPPLVAKAKTAEEFRKIWFKYAKQQRHFCSPDRPFPFPWADDIFVTDIVVAWFAPEGYPEGAYCDSMFWVREEDLEAVQHPAPIWQDKYPMRTPRKKVWLSCAVEEDIERRTKRRQRDLDRTIQNAYNEIPGDDTSDEWQRLAQEARESFDERQENIWKLAEKQRQKAQYASAPIPGPAIAHSAYQQQPEADSIMVIRV